MIIALFAILLAVLVLPFVVKKVEENLEAFLFIMGLTSVFVTKSMNWDLVKDALIEPISITLAVFVAGTLFYLLRNKFTLWMGHVYQKISPAVVVSIIIVVLGLLSSVITAIIASVILVELIYLMPLARHHKIVVCILACFSIGLGAALTPIGEPLATIAISKLDEDFFYLLTLIGDYVIPTIIVLGLLGFFYVRRFCGGKAAKGAAAQLAPDCGATATEEECPDPQQAVAAQVADLADEAAAIESDNMKSITIRALKVYLFVMALVFLGTGFQPMIDAYILGLDNRAIYWINMVSAILDNATLTAAEISPKMSDMQVEAILLGLLISGGMLVPGNIPNIISASKLKISMREWAKIGVPLGLIIMGIVFVIVFVI
jgi:predicted cation transporter